MEIRKKPKYEDIFAFVKDWWDLTDDELHYGRSPRAVEARYIVWAILRELGWSAKEISEAMDNSRWTIYSDKAKDQTITEKAHAVLALIEARMSHE
jgi:hypothetical protein